MDWCGVIMKFPKGVLFKDLPEEWKGPDMGSAGSIRDRLGAQLEWDDNKPGYAVMESGYARIELTYETDGPVNAISVTTSATTDAIPLLKQVCRCLKASVFDNQTGEIADLGKQTQQCMQELKRQENAIGSGG